MATKSKMLKGGNMSEDFIEDMRIKYEDRIKSLEKELQLQEQAWNSLAEQNQALERSILDLSHPNIQNLLSELNQYRLKTVNVVAFHRLEDRIKEQDRVLMTLVSKDEDCNLWRIKYEQLNKELMCELRDPNGTIWEHAKSLQDKLDEAKELEMELRQTWHEDSEELKARIKELEAENAKFPEIVDRNFRAPNLGEAR